MINRALFVIGLIFLIGAISLLWRSTTYERYTNSEEYNTKYLRLSDDENRSLKFQELRKEYLTPKFKLEDYGITLSLLSIPCFVISAIGICKLRTLNSKGSIISVGILAALLTNIGYVGELFLEMGRESFPHWSDSLAIPLMGVPFLFMVSLLWVVVNLLGIKGNFKTSVLIFPFRFDKLNYWYSSIIILTMVLLSWEAIGGKYWWILPNLFWLYFYFNILLGIRQTKKEEESLN